MSAHITRRAALLLAAASPLLAGAAERRTAEIDLDGRKISIQYDAIRLNGRRFGRNLAPYGKVWRFGSEAPRITVTAYTLTALFELLPGSYSLFVVPHPDKWTLMPSTATDGKTYSPSKNIGRLELPVQKLSEPVQQLTFAFTRQASNVTQLRISIDRASVSTELKVL